MSWQRCHDAIMGELAEIRRSLPPQTEHVKTWTLMFAHVAAMLEVYARVEGMRADNAVREFQHESPAWSGECFFEQCENLRKHVVALRRL